MTTQTNIELLKAALVDLRVVMDSIAGESGDSRILSWLGPVEERLKIVVNRYTNDVKAKLR